MTDSEKLARWQGYKPATNIYGVAIPDSYTFGNKISNLPDYLNDDSAAMSLLDTLVEKGGNYKLSHSPYGHTILIYYNKVLYRSTAATRREAVVAACLNAVMKEEKE